jgi:hypothetical protein
MLSTLAEYMEQVVSVKEQYTIINNSLQPKKKKRKKKEKKKKEKQKQKKKQNKCDVQC